MIFAIAAPLGLYQTPRQPVFGWISGQPLVAELSLVLAEEGGGLVAGIPRETYP